MGCSQSKPVDTTVSVTSAPPTTTIASSSVGTETATAEAAAKKKISTASSLLTSKHTSRTSKKKGSKVPQAPPATRQRADSWNHVIATTNGSANGGGSPTGAGTGAASSPSSKLRKSPVEVQWQLLWDTQSAELLDPVDVHSVLDSLLARQINKLSATEVTLLQRRVRATVKLTAATSGPKQASTSKIMGRVFGVSPAEHEARAVADKHHLLSQIVVARIFRPCYIPAVAANGSSVSSLSSSSLSSSAEPVNIMQNAYTLMLHLQEPLWDRVADIAVQTAVKARLEMDVNKQVTTDHAWTMPRPSVVPDVTEPPVLPPGVSFSSLVFLTALALRGTRQQRLQLLFYLLLPGQELNEFLATHPAGGVPTWLLEVGNDTVASLASLTHYHYYGNAFLPRDVKMGKFAASNSRRPISIPSLSVLAAVQTLLLKVETRTKSAVASASASPAMLRKVVNVSREATDNNAPLPPLSPSKRNSLKLKKGSNHNSSDALSELPTPEFAANGDAPSALLQRLKEVAGHVKPDYEDIALEKSKQKCLKAPRSTPDKALWTLEDFSQWAEQALDDLALDAMMHRLFAAGILPSHSTERDLARQKWEEWHVQIDSIMSANKPEGTYEMLTQSVKELLQSCQNGVSSPPSNGQMLSTVWGGMGGVDGGGGVGHGVLYCVDKKWWDAWTKYVGWSWIGERPVKRRNMTRPGALSTEALLDRDPESLTIPGTLGSYEQMRHALRKNTDYVLIPPGVWDVLYEMYGGGPPLPRMVKPPQRKYSDTNGPNIDMSESSYGDAAVDIDAVMGSFDEENGCRVMKLPDALSVTLHPWVLHCHLCDPQQPYRRGDAGPVSIRVMVTPDQPLWRVYVELIARFPLQAYKAFGSDGRGQARIWKKIEPSANRDPASRYGLWNLLCRNRHGLLPMTTNGVELREHYTEFTANWQAYTDNATVDSIGLADRDHVMLEFAVLNKSGELMFPREAAAKAGRVRRLAEEDKLFRQTIQGVDENGSLLPVAPVLVGMEVDAMDSIGRWYPVVILVVEIVDEDTDEEPDDAEDERGRNEDIPPKNHSTKRVKVDFQEHGGHIEWIDVESDLLAKAGRFTGDSEKQSSPAETPANASTRPAANDTKAKPAGVVKKASNGDSSNETGKLCLLPGYGACGLANLGNTCYVNSAIQCISYFPLLRSYLLSAQYKAKGDLNKDNPLGTGGRLLEEFAELLRAMWSAKQGEKSPIRFRSQLAKVNEQFSGADQQDAQEFLNYMLDVLHEDSNKVITKPYVEALEDDWVKKSKLPRVGEEAWRRFLRRNRSIMADVAMGQVLNTVTCPVCKFSSRNFDPFNLLSIPIPTVADVIFQCVVVRRATALNCPKTLNKPRKGDKRPSRFSRKLSGTVTGPPSENYVVEQYVIAMSRLADSGDLRIQIQNICGIPASSLRLCRAEVIELEKAPRSNSVLGSQTKIIPLTDKEGPCSQLAKKRAPNDTSPVTPTQILAFENTLDLRPVSTGTAEPAEDTADEEEDDEDDDDRELPTAKEQAELERYLEVYGDEKECRVLDTDPFVLTKAVSRSLWPRTEKEMKLGLRVDAKDHRGNWFPGSVVDSVEATANGSDADSEKEVEIQTKKVRVHFDNFSTKWDELYSIEHFREGRVRPIYSHASPRAKPTEFLVHNRHTDRDSGESVVFGQSFYVQCHNDWSNARAGAHILAQSARFLIQSSKWSGPVDTDDPNSPERQVKAQRLYDKTHGAISDLIDCLVDCDREYIRLVLGVSEHNSEEEKAQPYRNPSFDPTTLSAALVKKVDALLHRLPFEVRVCSLDAQNSVDKAATNLDELPYDFSLVRSIGNSINARHAIILQWREPPTDKKSTTGTNILDSPVMYVTPTVAIHEASAQILKNSAEAMNHHGRKSRAGSGGLDLGVCLAEFCKVQKLTLADNWRCPRCKECREGRQNMNLWRLPDLMTFHIKRFNMSARWREKITTKVNFPLTGLDMSEWCHKESPAIKIDPQDAHVYDLIGVVNHYGSMTGGHYVATCKATGCGRDGKEEVAYNFNGVGASAVEIEDADVPSGWRLGRKVEVNQGKVAAAMASRAATESAEPVWLQFDDELVEAIPPRQVVSEMAYVLFYRRRRMTPANIAKYSTLE